LLVRLRKTLEVLCVGAAVGDDLVAALADRVHDLRRVPVEQAVAVVPGRQLQLVEQLEQAPDADAVAIVPPGVVAVGLRLTGLRRVVPEPGAEGEPFDVGRDRERETRAARPAVVLALGQGNVVVAIVLRERELDRHRQSALAPEAFTTGASLAISLSIMAWKGSGVVEMAPAPSCWNTDLISSVATTLANSALSFLTIAGSSPFGPRTPLYRTISKFGTPASIIVGTSGAAATRFGVVTASARSLPALAFDTAGGIVDNT